MSVLSIKKLSLTPQIDNPAYERRDHDRGQPLAGLAAPRWVW
jgi:hypothetical protein